MAKKKTRLEEKIWQLAEEKVETLGFDLVDVEYVKEGNARFLRLFIDKKGGVGLEDCVQVSQALDAYLEEELQLTEAYYFEVSSPGLDRPLQTEKDFWRHLGEEVEVGLYQAREGRKKIRGRICGLEAGGILLLETEKGLERFEEKERSLVKQLISFD